MVRGIVSSQSLCCSCNGSRARCVRCLCSRRGNPCTNCKAGSCRNTAVNSSTTTPPDEHPQTSPARSTSPVVAAETQPRTLEEVSDSSYPLPAYDRAQDNYRWGDRSAETVTPLIEAAYREVMHWRPNLFVPPSGNAANDLVAEMTRLFHNFLSELACGRIGQRLSFGPLQTLVKALSPIARLSLLHRFARLATLCPMIPFSLFVFFQFDLNFNAFLFIASLRFVFPIRRAISS